MKGRRQSGIINLIFAMAIVSLFEVNCQEISSDGDN